MSKGNANRDLTDKDLFSTGEAAALCGVSQQTIIRCFDRGELEGFRIPGSRTRRIPRESLLEFIRRNRLPEEALEQASRRILVVDDEPHLTRRLREALADRRFVIKRVTNGFDGGVLAVQFSPDIILLNIQAPAVEPSTFRQRLRSLGKIRRLVLLLVGEKLDARERRVMAECRSDEVLRMPVEVDRLVRMITRSVRADRPLE